MDKNQKYVITINRELGSGGRTVGRILSEKLGVPFYDKALINELKAKYNLSMNEVWYYDRMAGQETHLVTSSEMFEVEKEILKNVAEEESCVIAGRSGFSVFKDHPNHLSILIQAPLEHRIQRIMRKQNLSHEEAEKIIKKVDEMRENYVKKYTGTSRYDARNYDLVICSEGKTEEEVAALILQYIG